MSERISVAELVERVVSACKGGMVSTGDMILMLRRQVPDCEHTDAELEQLIATIAIQHGCDLSFGPAPFPLSGQSSVISGGVANPRSAANVHDLLRPANQVDAATVRRAG